MKKLITLLFLFVFVAFVNGQNSIAERHKATFQKNASSKSSIQKSTLLKDTLKKSNPLVGQQEIVKDTVVEEVRKFKPYKKSVHASYYADKFNGVRTTSGIRFDNNKYSAAHKKFPFGTKLRITNEANGKSVIVEVIDRGPFVRSREIDISKRAFMEIAKNKGAGSMIVTIEELVK